MTGEPPGESVRRRRLPPLDFIILFLLVFANLPGESDLEFGSMMTDLGRTSPSWRTFFDRSLLDNPIASAQAAFATALLILYGLTAFGVIARGRRWSGRLRAVLLGALVALLVVAPAVVEIDLRFAVGPKGHAHDGGVIQTEEALRFFLAGIDPYVADYRNTPMATLEWGPGNPAINHHPYFPFSFLAHAPFYAAGRAIFGRYDARFLYLLLFAVPFFLVRRWSASGGRALALAALWGLNPFLAPHIVQGRNDVVVLVALLLALHLALTRRWAAAALLFGIACSTKQFALLFAPFLLLLAGRGASSWAGVVKEGARRLWPAAIPLVVFVLPFVLWDAAAFFDDTVAFNTGSSLVSYPLGGTPGYGGANFVNIFALVKSRYDYFPFWIFQLLVVLPALALLLRWQRRENTAARSAAAFSLFLLVFLYCSRIFHINYLGPVFFLAALALLGDRFGGPGSGAGDPAGPAAGQEAARTSNSVSSSERNESSP